jgi:hypothetical protein
MAIGLICVGIFLIYINVKAIQKDKDSFKYKYDNAKDNMEEFQVEIGKLRKEFAETILELQNEIVELRSNTVEAVNETDRTEEKIVETGEKSIKPKEDAIENSNMNDNNIKIEKIHDLLDDGFTVDQIADKLQLGKGEVILIKELYLK